MRLERSNNLSLNTVTPNFVAIFVLFGTASSFIERISFSEIEAKRKAIFFLFACSKVNSTSLENHLRASQSARAKRTVHWSPLKILTDHLQKMNEISFHFVHNWFSGMPFRLKTKYYSQFDTEINTYCLRQNAFYLRRFSVPRVLRCPAGIDRGC